MVILENDPTNYLAYALLFAVVLLTSPAVMVLPLGVFHRMLQLDRSMLQRDTWPIWLRIVLLDQTAS